MGSGKQLITSLLIIASMTQQYHALQPPHGPDTLTLPDANELLRAFFVQCTERREFQSAQSEREQVHYCARWRESAPIRVSLQNLADFFQVSNGIDENEKKVYDIDVAMQRPDRSHFGILHLTFQLFTRRELVEAQTPKKVQKMVPQSPRSIVKPVKSARGNYPPSSPRWKQKDEEKVKSPRTRMRAVSEP